MAEVKITDASPLTNPASTDVLAIVDVAADITKKVKVEDLVKNAGDGTAAAPSFSFDSDPNSGLYNESADKIGFSTNGIGRVYVDGSGNIGIAQINPSAPLEFGKSDYGENSSEDFYRIKFNNSANTANDIGIGQPDANSIALNSSNNGSIIFYQGSDGEVARFHTNGFLGIGNTTPTRTLDVTGTAAVSGALTAGSAAIVGTLTQNGNNVLTVGETGAITSAMIANDTIVDADINASAAIGLSKLATGALPTGITVASANIADGAIVNDDINASADIGLGKLATGALPTGITIASANIVDGTIVNGDINASAAIGLSKLATGALPTNITIASANIVDGTIVDADVSATAEIAVSKLASGTARELLQTNAAGTGVEFTSNVDIPGTLDVSSTAIFDGNVGVGESSPSEKLSINGSILTKTVAYSSSVDDAYLIAGSQAYTGQTTNWGSYGFQHRFKSDSGGVSRITVDNYQGEVLCIDQNSRVGIGTTNPYNDLVVKGTGNATTTSVSPGEFTTTIQTDSAYIHFGKVNNIPTIQGSGTGTGYDLALNPFNGNVGIGTSAPSQLLDLASTAPNIRLTDTVDGYSEIDGNAASLKFNADKGNNKAGSAMNFAVDNITRMQINDSGTVRIGQTSTNIPGLGNTTIGAAFEKTTSGIALFVSRSNRCPAFFNRNSNGEIISFLRSGTLAGKIQMTTTSVSLVNGSDYRLKENVTDLSNGIDRLKLLTPRRFNFIAEPDQTIDGFIAHEMFDAVPEAVFGEKDAMEDQEFEVTPAVLDEDGNVTTEAVIETRSVISPQGIDQGKLVPLLTAALQEAIAKIETLETKVAALEAG